MSAGCLPTLATIPIFWGLYRSLSNAAGAGLLTEGFYWIPSLSGPTSLAAQRAGRAFGVLHGPHSLHALCQRACPVCCWTSRCASGFCSLQVNMYSLAQVLLVSIWLSLSQLDCTQACKYQCPANDQGANTLTWLHAGSGAAWLFPLVDGAPPIGWADAAKYMVLPVLLVAAQFASSAIISPPIKQVPALMPDGGHSLLA